MDNTELLEMFTREQRIELDFPGISREVDGSVIRHISLTGEDGFVIYSRLDEESADAAISAQIARFQSIPQDFEWKVYDYDPPKDLIERLRRRGFEIGHPEALLKQAQAVSRKIFHALGCRHLGRVDWIADHTGRLWFLEVNTIPGFTSHSLVPKAAARIGISFEELVERLVLMAWQA